MGETEGFAKKLSFSRIWSFYSYIAFYRRDNRENYRILVRDEASSWNDAFGLVLKWYGLRFVTLRAIPIIGLNRDGVIDFLASFASFHSVLFLLSQPTRQRPIPPNTIAPGTGIGS